MLNTKELNQPVGCVMADKDLDSRMTEMETEFKHMSKQLDSIATDMKQVLQIASQVSVISERQSNHQNDLNRAFEEIRKLNSNHTDYDRQQDGRIKTLESQLQISDRESQAWINKFKAAIAIFLFMFSFIQGMMVYGGKNLIEEVRQQHDQLLAISNKLPR